MRLGEGGQWEGHCDYESTLNVVRLHVGEKLWIGEVGLGIERGSRVLRLDNQIWTGT